jgi:hypothetical protein
MHGSRQSLLISLTVAVGLHLGSGHMGRVLVLSRCLDVGCRGHVVQVGLMWLSPVSWLLCAVSTTAMCCGVDVNC